MSQVASRQIQRQSTQAQYSYHTNAAITIRMTLSYPTRRTQYMGVTLPE